MTCDVVFYPTLKVDSGRVLGLCWPRAIAGAILVVFQSYSEASGISVMHSLQIDTQFLHLRNAGAGRGFPSPPPSPSWPSIPVLTCVLGRKATGAQHSSLTPPASAACGHTPTSHSHMQLSPIIEFTFPSTTYCAPGTQE